MALNVERFFGRVTPPSPRPFTQPWFSGYITQKMLAYLLYLSAYTVFRQGIARFANTVPYHKKILGLSHEHGGKFDSIVKDTQTSDRQPMSIIAKKKV